MKLAILFSCLMIFFTFPALNAQEAPPDTIERMGNMVKIPAGVFYMGSSSQEGFTNERPYHPVYLEEFWIDIFEVTIQEYVDFLNSGDPADPAERDRTDRYYNPLMRDEKVCGIYRNPNGSYSVVPGRDRYPVTYVSWEAANAYAKWAGKRLPTEAEWEKAARGGQLGSQYSTRSYLSHTFANYEGRRSWDYWEYTSPVGVFDGNDYGVYDMTGNVWEWTQDYYNPNFYSADTMYSPINDPEGNHPFKYRIIRGGSWADTYEKDNNLRVSCRGPNYPIPDYWAARIGFRCASSTKPAETERLTGIDYQIERLKASNPDKYASLATDSLRKIVLRQNEIQDDSYTSGIKSMRKAVAFSAIVPGTGEIYSGRWKSGLFFLTAEAAGWSYYLINYRQAKKISTSFADFAERHFSYETYELWLDDYIDTYGGRKPPNYEDIQLFEEITSAKSGSAKVKSAYYDKLEHDQFLAGWDDYDLMSGEYGSSQNRDNYIKERSIRRTRKSDYNSRVSVARMAIVGNHLLSIIDTIWGLKRHTIYRSKGWSWDMSTEMHNEAAINLLRLRYRW